MNTEEKKLTGYPSIDKPWLKYYSEEAINAKLPECTLYEYLWENNKEHLNECALNYFGTKITYRELFEKIDIVSKAFVAQGVKTGDVVTLCTVGTPETIWMIYALNKIGAVSNIIEPRTNATQIRDRINQANSKVVIVLDVFLEKVNSIIDETCMEKGIVVPLAESMNEIKRILFFIKASRKFAQNKNFLTWKNFIVQGKTADRKTNCVYRKNMPAAIIYTGGTTGIAKGAVLSNDAINAIACQYKLAFSYDRGDKFLNIMPPFISYGLVCGIHMPISLGMTDVIIPNFRPEIFDKLIAKHRPAVVLGVPSHYEKIMYSPILKNKDLSFIKWAAMGGDYLNIESERKINQFLKEHHSVSLAAKGYGMTEMGSAVCTCSHKINLLGSVGVPLVNNTIAIFEPESDKELPYNVQGEVCLQGPSMMNGYFHNDEETQKVIRKHSDGSVWVHTQDIGYINEDGSLFIIDRLKRMIVCKGHNIWPSQIEMVVMEHCEVDNCVVVAGEDPSIEHNHIPVAFIVLKDASTIDKNHFVKEIDDFCRQRLPERDLAQRYEFIDAIPLTAVGKVDYRELERLAK